MTITCTKEHLVRGLTIIEHALGKNATLPILEHVALRTQAGKLTLTATDLEIAATASIPAKVEGEDAWTVPARILSGFVASLPDGPVQMKKSGKTLSIKGKQLSGKLHLGSIDDFPIIPELTEDVRKITFKTATLRTALEEVAVATATTESRPELNGISCIAEGVALTFAATDTFRLAVRSIAYEDADSFSIILPTHGAQEFVRLFKDIESVTLFIGENQFVAEGGDIHFTSRLVEGSFPDYTAILPQENEAHIQVDRKTLLERLEAATYFTSRLNDVSLLTQGGKKLTITAKNSDVGEYTTDIDGRDGEGDSEAAFNIRYLMDGIRSFSSEQITLEINGAQKPTVLRPEEQTERENDLYLVMPIRTA